MGGSDREDYDNNGDYRYGSPVPHTYGPGWEGPHPAPEGEVTQPPAGTADAEQRAGTRAAADDERQPGAGPPTR